MTPAERRKAARVAAKPEVMRLVRKYGRSTIANILATLREKERAAEKVKALKREIADLERRV